MTRGNKNCPDNPPPSMAKQISEDTCTKHGVFCCPECFNMEPSDIEIEMEDDND